MAGALTLASLTATGCPDPQGKLDGFLDDTRELRDLPLPKEDLGGQLEDISGEFLMVVASVIDPTHPLQFLATQEFTPEGLGGRLTLTLQPLALEPQSIDTPRTPVGDSIVIPDIVVDEDGRYAFPAGDGVYQTFMVTGAANPITGSDIVTELRYVGSIQSADFVCGIIEGNVIEPLMASLEGSTFSAIRVASSAPGDLPVPITDFPTDCSGVPDGGGTTGGDTDTGSTG
ncbi:MAG: hypothetical protein H6713_04905 [Myxococcales bacterium]|nr:hypothetical protein [Myxococcales bacterium]MCB9749332.1 hypothetical protein [Myxococcales bacterium]